MLEVGPGNTLSTLTKRHPQKTSEQITLTSLRHPQEDTADLTLLLKSLGQLWLAGVELDWDNFYGEEQHYRVPYPLILLNANGIGLNQKTEIRTNLSK